MQVEFALRKVVRRTPTIDEIRSLEGIGFPFTNDQIEASGRGTPSNQRFDRLVASDPSQINQRFDRLVASDPSQILFLPARPDGTVDDPDDLRRQRLLKVYDGFPTTDVLADDFDLAAGICRATQRRGYTVRSQLNCVIAAIAIRCEATLVHDDVDFDRMVETVDTLSVLRLARS